MRYQGRPRLRYGDKRQAELHEARVRQTGDEIARETWAAVKGKQRKAKWVPRVGFGGRAAGNGWAGGLDAQIVTLTPGYSDAVLYDGDGKRIGVMDRVTRVKTYDAGPQ